MAAADRQFAKDVREGLGERPKKLPCIYFYDDRGSRLFERICDQPEYYPTRAEREIIRMRADDIASNAPDPVQVVELGSGNSAKTFWLLEALLGGRERVTYLPVDVCGDILEDTAAELKETLPGLAVRPIAARYEEGLRVVNPGEGGVFLLWLGSSIGNLDREEAASFLASLKGKLSKADRMLIGIDLVKEQEVLECAYNDEAGVTAEFNLNMLARINRDLGGTFDLEEFRHVVVYNSGEGRVEMYLESSRDQEVSIEAIDATIPFKAGERIHTENCHKYDLEGIQALAKGGGLRLLNQWFDSNCLFSLNFFGVDGRDPDG